MKVDVNAMSRLFWNAGGVYISDAETPDPVVPALGRVNLEHDAPVPRQGDNRGYRELRFSVAPCGPMSSAVSLTSKDQHRITIAIEPVPPLHGLLIDGEDLVAARKRRREDQQRRLG